MQQLTDGARRTEQHHSTSLQNPTDQNELTVKEKKYAILYSDYCVGHNGPVNLEVTE